MHVLITGIDGFIGHHLARAILERTDWRISGIDIADRRTSALVDPRRLEFLHGDVRAEWSWLDAQVAACDVVLPLAACAQPSEYMRDPLGIFELDFEASLRVVRSAVEHGSRLVFPSSSEVYGMSEDPIFDEETTPLVLGPVGSRRWIYASSKQLLDRVIRAYGEQRGLSYSIFRPFNWFGPHLDDPLSSGAARARVITRFLGDILSGRPIEVVGDGRQRRCFTHVDDGIDGLMRILRNERGCADGGIFNLGHPGNDISIGELAPLMLDIASAFPGWGQVHDHSPIHSVDGDVIYGPGYEDVSARRPAIHRAQSQLDWSPEIGLRKGLHRTIAHAFITHSRTDAARAG